MLLHIKHMVCNRCIMAVEHELRSLGYRPIRVDLGEAEIEGKMEEGQILELQKRLQQLGFELIDNTKGQLIERIKTSIIHLVHHSNEDLKVNLSQYLEDKLHKDYTYLSNLFSETQGTTIEKYYIAQKVERVKELLIYDELSLSEIADRLGYSSAAYLSNQFKKVTGLTPGHFRHIRENRRKPLDEV